MADENNNENTGQNEQNTKTENIKFYSLAPVESEHFNKYNDAFRFIFNKDNNHITNIAISGPYASGKSSVMKACINKFKNNKYLTISLSEFNDINSTKKNENIEAQLINQLVHKIDSRKIKESRFILNKKIDTKSDTFKNSVKKHVFLLTILLFSFIILLIDKNIFSNMLFNDNYKEDLLNLIGYIQLIFLILIVSTTIIYIPILMYNLLSFLFAKKLSIKKINFQGAEIDLFSDYVSIFDKYTDEILYLFKSADVNVFIFEDIDRYDDLSVFKKLRELNILLNDKLKLEKNDIYPIKFIYLICEKMFQAEERTKFFDYIIPIIPHVHNSNAYDFMEKLFPQEFSDKNHRKFLLDISLFIDNSRILYSISNEYKVFKKFLYSSNIYILFNKLLAIIIYKNLFPQDFNLLYFNDGYLADLFNKKHENDSIKSVDKTIRELYMVEHDEMILKPSIKYASIYNCNYFILIKYLIINGHIDETYKDYLTEITDKHISNNERIYLKNILLHNGKQLSFRLEKNYNQTMLDNLFMFIDNKNYNSIEILNYDIFDAIILNNDIVKFNIFIKCIRETKAYDFLFYYFEKNKFQFYSTDEHYNKMISSLLSLISVDYRIIHSVYNNNSYNNGLLKFILNIFRYNISNPDRIRDLRITILDFIDEKNTIFLSNLNKIFDNNDNIYYKEKDINYYENKDLDICISDLNKMKFKFYNIAIKINPKLYNLILENKMFDVNYKNIMYITHNKVKDESESVERYLESILNMDNKDLKEYILSNFKQVIETYPNEYIKYIYIEQELYNLILNNTLITDEHKKIFRNLFLRKQQTTLNDANI